MSAIIAYLLIVFWNEFSEGFLFISCSYVVGSHLRAYLLVLSYQCHLQLWSLSIYLNIWIFEFSFLFFVIWIFELSFFCLNLLVLSFIPANSEAFPLYCVSGIKIFSGKEHNKFPSWSSYNWYTHSSGLTWGLFHCPSSIMIIILFPFCSICSLVTIKQAFRYSINIVRYSQ